MAHVRLPYFSTSVGRMLFPHFKKIVVTAHVLDERAVSAVEFGRQMTGPNLLKENPKMEYVMNISAMEGDAYPDPTIEIEYNNGLVWKTKTEDFSCGELRAGAFNRAKLVEFDEIMAGKGKSDSDDGGKKGGKAAAPKKK